jgi:hydroxymethylglutaryl-CoA lyase
MGDTMPETADQTAIFLEDEALRDGLQMEARSFSLEEKLQIFELLQTAGVPRVQVGSFVHPKIVPQMADTDALIHTIRRTAGQQAQTVISALILNGKGLERALNCGVPHVSMSVSVSDTHSRKNARKPAADALTGMVALLEEALGSEMAVRAGLQCVFGCVYEGAISKRAVLSAAEALARTGVTEINLADTTGMATPAAIQEMVGRFADELPELQVSLHLHDTRGLGLANMFAGYEAGVRIFDVCTGGLGGCPFVKGAAGNVPAEDAVNMFETMGIETGIDLHLLGEVVSLLEAKLDRQLPGRMRRVMDFQQTCP